MKNLTLINKYRKRVIIISFMWRREKDLNHPIGHMSILAKIKLENIKIKSFIFNVKNNSLNTVMYFNKIFTELNKFKSIDTDIALGVYVWNENIIKKLLKTLRLRGFLGRIILGGPQISYTNDNLVKLYPEADIFIKGYAEESFLKVIKTSNNNGSVINLANINEILKLSRSKYEYNNV